ncbi:hypothetical protein BU16DRAFT_542548 [Lophium mytilinum]|uniref:Uncharacterized protein n=1 Tax=Lophium mytilinum TaxID=390894 RepID=A0A6A6QH86_9PEZI|nr:hypothetical protein BU16DRAFT_542548 [Lophium mytilinum]
MPPVLVSNPGNYQFQHLNPLTPTADHPGLPALRNVGFTFGAWMKYLLNDIEFESRNCERNQQPGEPMDLNAPWLDQEWLHSSTPMDVVSLLEQIQAVQARHRGRLNITSLDDVNIVFNPTTLVKSFPIQLPIDYTHFCVAITEPKAIKDAVAALQWRPRFSLTRADSRSLDHPWFIQKTRKQINFDEVHAIFRDMRLAGIPIILQLNQFNDFAPTPPPDWGLVKWNPDEALRGYFAHPLFLDAFIHLVDEITIEYADLLNMGPPPNGWGNNDTTGNVRELRPYGQDGHDAPIAQSVRLAGGEDTVDLMLKEFVERAAKRQNRLLSYFFRHHGARMRNLKRIRVHYPLALRRFRRRATPQRNARRLVEQGSIKPGWELDGFGELFHASDRWSRGRPVRWHVGGGRVRGDGFDTRIWIRGDERLGDERLDLGAGGNVMVY